MPKYTRKNRLQQDKIGRAAVADDCSSIDDGVSSLSNISDLVSVYDDEESSGSLLIVTTENIEDKLENLIDDLRTKDGRTRVNALEKLQTLFRQKILLDCESVIEPLLNCLRRGNEVEGKLATSVSSLLALQLTQANDEYFKRVADVLLFFIRDESKSSSQRAKYIEALGVICFLSSEDISSTVELMNQFESMFSRSYHQTDGTSAMIADDIHEVHTAALSSWSLLMTTLPDNQAHYFIRTYAPEKISGLIESQHANLRSQAGETIAILYEIAREIRSVFAEPPESLLIQLEKKSKESAKYKSKKEKRLQHATFREIYNWFEDGTIPYFEVKFAGETLEINSWTSRFYYSIFSHLLGAGITTHLKENLFFRSIFNLEEAEMSPKKAERQQANKTSFKIRTEQLKKSRADKFLRNCNVDF